MRRKFTKDQTTVANLLGKTLINIEVDDDSTNIVFTTSDGKRWIMYHEQDCCESVFIDDVIGEWDALLGTPLLMAEEESSPGEVEDGTATWTFYKFGTVKGYVTLKWWGESNGYYSESVDFAQLEDES